MVESRTEHFRNRFLTLVSDDVRLGDAEPVRRDYIADHLGAVAVVAYDEKRDAVLLVEQYRHPVRRRLWELPAGLLDVAGEPAISCAQRELAEEADLSANRWDVLVDLLVTPGSSDEAIRIFLARDVAPLPNHLRHEREHEEANMVIEWVPVADAVSRVLAGEIENAACVSGVLALARVKDANWPPLREVTASWVARPDHV